MKLFLFLLAAACGLGFWFNYREQTDPVKCFERIVRRFPDENHFGNTSARLTGVKYNVRKTESLVNPFVGQIFFTVEPADGVEMEFRWRDQKWEFERLISMRDGEDITHDNVAFLHGTELAPVLKECGWDVAPATPTPEPKAHRVTMAEVDASGQITLQRAPTPAPVEVSQQIAKKYGRQEPAATPQQELGPRLRYIGKVEQHFPNGALLMHCGTQLQADSGPEGWYVLEKHPDAGTMPDGTGFVKFYARAAGLTTYPAATGGTRTQMRLVYSSEMEAERQKVRASFGWPMYNNPLEQKARR